MLVPLVIMQDRLQDGILRVEGRRLRKKADLELAAHRHAALIRLLEPRDDAEKCRLTGAVHADQRDLLALVDGKICILKDLPLGIDLAEMFDRNDVVLCHTLPYFTRTNRGSCRCAHPPFRETAVHTILYLNCSETAALGDSYSVGSTALQ